MSTIPSEPRIRQVYIPKSLEAIYISAALDEQLGHPNRVVFIRHKKQAIFVVPCDEAGWGVEVFEWKDGIVVVREPILLRQWQVKPGEYSAFVARRQLIVGLQPKERSSDALVHSATEQNVSRDSG